MMRVDMLKSPSLLLAEREMSKVSQNTLSLREHRVRSY